MSFAGRTVHADSSQAEHLRPSPAPPSIVVEPTVAVASEPGSTASRSPRDDRLAVRLLRCVQERATVRGNASPPALLQRKLLTFRDADHEALTRQGIPTDLTFKEVPAQVGVSQASNYDCKTSGLATSGATGCAVLIGRKGRRLTMAHSPAQVNSTDWGGMEVLVESDARDELYVVYGTEYKDCVSTAVAHPANQAALKHETLTPTYVYDAAWVAIARRGETTFLLTSHNGVQQPV